MDLLGTTIKPRRGLHWICFSNFNCDDGIVNLYGSILMEMTGVHAIANMVSILHGVDPSSVSFHVSVMRRHLQQGLENKEITVFPHRAFQYFVHEG